MLKVFSRIPGAMLFVGPQPATDTVPALVSDDQAEGLAIDVAQGLIRVEVEPGSTAKVAWHSLKGDVYHDSSSCSVGNNIERENLQSGTGKKKRCSECAGTGRSKAAEKKE